MSALPREQIDRHIDALLCGRSDDDQLGDLNALVDDAVDLQRRCGLPSDDEINHLRQRYIRLASELYRTERAA